MAVELKQGEILADPRDLNKDIADAYGVITQVNINHNFRTGQVTMEVYPRSCTQKERANSTVKPCFSYDEQVDLALYEQFFDKEIFSDGWNPQKAGYKMFADFEIEEEGQTVKKYDIWKSDEE